MSKIKLFLALMITQVLLTWITISEDININITIFQIMDLVGIPILVIGWAMFTGLIALFLNKKNMADFVSFFIFLSVSAVNILGLLYIIIGVIMDGPLNESGLIFIAFPAFGFFTVIASAIIGSIVYLVKNKKK